MRWAITTAMMATLAGCASVEDPFLTGSVSGGISPSAPALTQEVSSSYALAGLASAVGAPRSVRQTATGGENTIRQVIVYGNTTRLAGENVIVVEGGKGVDGRYRRAPSRNQLIAEMNRALPGVPMRISAVIGENPYGVYGYATGPYAGGACIYGWQAANTGGAGYSAGRLLGGTYPAQVRLRFCDARISEERIPLLMQSLSLKPMTSDTIAMLRNIRGSTVANGSPLYGNDMLFDVPAERSQSAAYAPPVAEPRSVQVEQPSPRPVTPRRAVTVTEPVLRAQAPVQAEKPAPVILNAAKVPLPGEQVAATETASAAQPAETVAALKQKAADAWSAARSRITGSDDQNR